MKRPPFDLVIGLVLLSSVVVLIFSIEPAMGIPKWGQWLAALCFFGAITIGIIAAVHHWLQSRRTHRRNTGHCARCGYSQRDVAMARCPECGYWDPAPRARAAASEPTSSRRGSEPP